MLGELQVVDGDVDVPIRGAKQRVLLLLLLVRARETVQAERLADELWGDDPPGRRRQRAAGPRVQAAARPGSAERRALTTGAGGYRLDVADDEIDARCFEAAAARGREALRAGEATPTAAARWPPGASLWRGPALDGSDDEGILRREATRLEELAVGVRSRTGSTPTCGAGATPSWWASWSSWSGRRRCASGSTAS